MIIFAFFGDLSSFLRLVEYSIVNPEQGVCLFYCSNGFERSDILNKNILRAFEIAERMIPKESFIHSIVSEDMPLQPGDHLAREFYKCVMNEIQQYSNYGGGIPHQLVLPAILDPKIDDHDEQQLNQNLNIHICDDHKELSPSQLVERFMNHCKCSKEELIEISHHLLQLQEIDKYSEEVALRFQEMIL